VVPHLQLVRAGWPAEADPDLLWLKPHIARLRSKIVAASGPQVIPVRGVGYRLDAA
jgi:DNA-binding response OmpR family regulator